MSGRSGDVNTMRGHPADVAGMGIWHRQLAHGELQWPGRVGPHIQLAQVAAGMCTPSFVKLSPLGAMI